MKTPTRKTNLALYASGILACFSGTAGAAIYMDGFDADVGTQNGSQHDTTPVSYTHLTLPTILLV